MSGRPYGWRMERRDGERVWVPVEAEQRALSLLRELYAAGVSTPQICATLHKEGYRPGRGVRFGTETIHRYANAGIPKPPPRPEPQSQPTGRAKVVERPRLSGTERAQWAEDERAVADLRAQRPQTRADCRGGQRPCPWTSCRWHLYLDVSPSGESIKLNYPGVEVWELKHSCVLDMAEKGGVDLERVGEVVNLTRERIRQLEALGLEKLKRRAPWLRTHLLDPAHGPGEGER
jgi:hypothetical protein